MNWYYSLNNEQLGPVDAATFDQLVQQGTIGPQTLVWREGMAEWKPLAEAAPSSNQPAGAGLVCSQCRRAFSEDQMVKLGTGFVCAACKPVALQKLQEGILGDGTSEKIRQDHIKHEASIKSVGTLYMLSSGLFLVIGLMGVITGLTTARPGNQAGTTAPPVWVALVPMVLFMGISAFMLVVALALRKLKPWARIASGILSGIGLIGFPVGTLINGYILWLLLSKKGATVFSADYQRVIAETPHIKYRTSPVVVVLVIIVVLLIVLGIVGAALS